MLTTLTKSVLSTAVVVATATTLLSPSSASAASAPLSDARIARHFDLTKGQTPENIALAPDGSAYVTFAAARQVARLSPKGVTQILATLPAPADGGVHTPVLGFPLTSGIVRAHDGTLYFLYATGTADLTGVWRLRPGGTPERIAALPADGLPNGFALDASSRTLYVTDSVLGTIWKVPVAGGTPTAWSTAPELSSTGFLGANGLKIRGGALWVTNLDRGTVVRVPVLRDGRAGRVRTEVTGLPGIDDFAFTGRGDQLLATVNGSSEVVLAKPHSSPTVVLTATDGLRNPTSIALRGDTAYVLSAAYVTAEDPNLLLAHLDR
ncbi:SMP-30/gluconolactonase/LRE family protein [Streptomyces sp. NPDC101776]|uniref:SMP-30/gluconolactonase/LRE family protein n=1 Tax=Streptomyces sp. NPDC101776 TaxID=3366146 RepID=UPI00382176A9